MSWTQQSLAGNKLWKYVTSDTTGNIIYAGSQTDLYKSSDGGINWSSSLYTVPDNVIRGISTNSSAQYVAICDDSNVFVSSNFGATWQTTSFPLGIGNRSIAMDSDTGQILYVIQNGYIIISTNFGTTWTSIFVDSTIVNITCSSSGQYVYMCSANSIIYVSINNGSSFTTLNIGSSPLVSITCSSTGQNVFACSNTGGVILKSSNYGSSFSSVSLTGIFSSITCSSTGQNIAVCSTNGYIYISIDGGLIFSQSYYPASNYNWNSIKMSSSGNFIVAALLAIGKAPGYIYTYGSLDPPPPPPPPLVCFLENSKILTDKGYICIEMLKKGDLVKTLKYGYKSIDMIGKRVIYNPVLKDRIKDQLYKCSQEQYPELFEPLVITGCHSILIDNFKDDKQIEQTREVLGDIYITDKKYRLPACVDERASIYEIEGNTMIYHLALDCDDYYMNYGIYANGLLVETCSKRYLKELSHMELIE
jgi:photosystem II stability/assembly factor-like uncharacterized protein